MAEKSTFIINAKSIFFLAVFHLFNHYIALGQLQRFVAIDPNGAGGFELGTTFAANGWSEAQTTTGNRWVLGTNNGYISGTNRAAFIRNSGSGAANYNATLERQNFFFRTVTIPAGYSELLLSFLSYQEGSMDEDMWEVYIAPANAPPPVALSANISTGLEGYIGPWSLGELEYNTVELPDTLIGKSFRLIFSWKNSGYSFNPSNPPAIIDNIELVAKVPIITPDGGTFSIDNTRPTGGKNFNNFTDAFIELNDLKHTNYSSPIIFNVAAGQTFTGNLPILLTSGATFRRFGEGPNPIVIGTGGLGTMDAVFRIGDGVNYVPYGDVFNGIDVRSANNTVEFGYLLRGISLSDDYNNDDIQISNATIRLDSTNVNSIGVSCSNISGSRFNNLTITNCGLGGLFITETDPANYGFDNIIRNVVVGSDYTGTPTGNIGGGTTAAAFGIQLNNQAGFEISNCTIRNIASSGIKRGIWIQNASGIADMSANTRVGTDFYNKYPIGNNIYNNNIYGITNPLNTSTSASRGIEFGMLTTAGFEQSILIYNNHISDLTSAYSGAATASRILQGILLGSGNATTTIHAYYNTVIINGSGSLTASNSALEWGGSTAIYNVRNNNLVNLTGAQSGLAKHYLLVTTSATSAGAASSAINNNNYFLSNTTQGFTALRATLDAASLANWRSAITSPANIDINSIAANPVFVNLAARNFRPQNDSLNRAVPIQNLLTDISGTFRSSVIPDIGAIEFTPSRITTNPVNILAAGSVNTGGLIAGTLSGVTASGIVYCRNATSLNPIIGGSGSTVVNSSPLATTGAFSITLGGLDSSEVYLVRSFAINSQGTHYGNLIRFTPDFISQLPFVANFEGNWTSGSNGWKHTRFTYTGNSTPAPLNTAGPKDWQQNRNTGIGSWTSQGLSVNPIAAVTDSGALWIEDYNFASGNGLANQNYSRIETPAIDMSGSTNPYIRFYYYANQPANHAYPLILMASTDMGRTWKSIMRIQPNADVSFTSTTASGVMTSATPWQRIAIKIPESFTKGKTKFAFYRNAAFSASGNLFIDSLFIGEFYPQTIRSSQSGLWSNPGTWAGGVIPNGICNVVIDSGHTVTCNVNIARVQNLSLSGTFNFLSSSLEQTAQIFGNLNINQNGRFSLGVAGNRNIARSVYLGEGLNVSGVLDLGNSTSHALMFVGGIPSEVSVNIGGVITNDSLLTPGSISQVHFANSGGITIRPESNIIRVSNILNLVDGNVSTNAKLIAGVTGTDFNIFRCTPEAQILAGGLTLHPNLGTATRNITYGGGVNGNFPTAILNRDTIFTGSEIGEQGNFGFIRGNLTLNTQHHVKLSRNLLIGDTLNRTTAVSANTGVGGGLVFQRGILITSPNILAVGVNSAGSTGTDPSFNTTNPPLTHGSYILGAVSFIRPSTGNLTGSISVPLGVGANFLGSGIIDNVKRNITISAGSGWSGQIVSCSLIPYERGFVNPPQTSVSGSSIYRIQVLENRQLPAASTVSLSTIEETGKINRDIFYGTQNQLFVMQSPGQYGPWTVRSVATGTGAFAQNTVYTRTTETTAPGPVSGLGEYFAFGTTVPVMRYTGGDVVRNTSGVAAGTSNVQMVRIRVNISGTVPRNVTQLNLNSNGTTNVLGITNAKVFYTGNDTVFNTATQIGSMAVPMTGVYSFNVKQQLQNGDNFFWVTYDVGSLASSGQLLVANLTGIMVDDTLRTPASIPASGGRTISSSLSGPMTYLSSTTIHPNLNEIVPGSINNQLLRVSITTSSNGFSIPVTQFTLNVNGSTNPLVNIDSISVWYTGSDSNFNAPVLFGKTGTQSGAYFINGSQFLLNNNNYFWVTYNVPGTASFNAFADAELISATIAGAPQLPIVTAPAGFRLISAEYCRSGSESFWSSRSQIWNVTMGTLNNSSNCSTTGGPGSRARRYSNYTTTAARPTFTAGTTVSFSVNTSTCSSGNQAMLGIWIDYNNDGNFNGQGEQVHISPSFTTGTSVFRTGSITIPLNISAGLKRMRVVLEDNASTWSFSPCGEYATGETEDYLINILSTASPMTVSTVTSSHRILRTIYRGAGSVITTNPNYENDILRINVVTSSTGFSIPVTQFNLSVNGTQNPLANIDSITVWYSGGDSTYPSINYFGGISPQTGAYTVRGSQGLLNGNNYFWVLYNIADSAILNDFVDAEISAVTVASIPRIPTVSAPAGSRRIDIDYCTSVATNPTNNGEIWNVTVGSLNNSSTCATTGGTGSILGGYSNYTSTVAPPNLNAGSTVPFSIHTSSCGITNIAELGIWIDFNNDGDFLDAGEALHISPSFVWGPTVFRTGTLNIPLNATSGLRRMRVVLTGNTPTSPCGSYNEGETEDYLVNVVPASPPMTYMSSTSNHPSLSSVLPGSSNNQILRISVDMSSTGTPVTATQLNLSVIGSSNPLTNIDSIAVWYTGSNPNFVSPVFFGGRGPQSGAYTVTGSQLLQNNTNYFWVTYRIPSSAILNDSVDAEISSLTIAGTPRIPSVTAPVGSRKIALTYCVSAAFNPTTDGEIWNVTVGSLNNSSTCSVTGGPGSILGGYSNYATTVAPPNLAAGSSFPFSVHTSTCGSGYDGVLGIWIDFNNDGDFTDPGEQVHMSPVFTYGTAVFRTGSIMIPANASAGLRRMRVILNETSTTPILPCGSYGFGETEDYTVNITPPLPPMTFNAATSAHPTLVNLTRGSNNNEILRIRVIMSSTGSSVPVTQFNLGVNGSSNPLTNIDSIAVWYTGSNPNFVSPVFFGGRGPQSGAYTVTGSQLLQNDTNYFWVTYRIPSSAILNDSVDAEISSLTIAGTPRIPAITAPVGSRKIEMNYCASAATNPTTDGEIWNVTVGSLNNSSTCSVTGGPGSILGGYSNYTATVTPPNLSAGSSVPFSVHTSTCASNFDAVLGIWIDFNNDGDFTDPGEQVHMSPVFTYGTTVFRTGTLNIPTNVAAGLRRMRVIMEETGTSPILSCGIYSYGETEDYTVNIVPASFTYVWNQTLPGSFTTASNWTPARNTPSITDRLVFNNGANITINNVITQTVRSITISNNTLVNFNAIAPSVLSVTDTLALTSGRLICVTNTELTLGSSAAIGRIVGSGTIQGALTAWVNNTNNSYSFPLSQANLARLATINLNIAPATSGTIRVNFVSGSFSSTGIPYNDAGVVINKLTPAGFWSITPGNGFSLAPTGSYSLSLNAAGIIGVNNLSSLRISRRVNSSNPWDTAGVNAIATGTTASPVANRNVLRVFGEFTIGSDSMSNPLPVNLLRFDATEANGDVSLNWTTGSEQNNKGFDIEKSEDGADFKNIGFVKGMGNSNIEVNYSFLDPAPFTVNDVLYYRLRQIDFDGSYNLSKILKVERKSLNIHNVSAYPIPFNTYLKISIDANTEGVSKISLYDIHSRIVKTIDAPLNQGKNELLIPDVEMLSNGAYVIIIEQNGKLDILKIMKQ